MIRNTKMSFVAAVLSSLAMVSTASATVTRTIDFNDQYALSQLPYENVTFATSPWYKMTSGTSAEVVFTVQDNSGVGHYHVAYENQCMNCLTSAGRFGLNLQCTGQSSSPYCLGVDTTYYGRNVLPHTGPSSILWSAQARNPFAGYWYTRAFTPGTLYLENNQSVQFCGNSTSYGVFCTGYVAGPGVVNLQGFGNVTWLEIHGAPNSAPYQFDNAVVTF
jgi:hypothetical protein